MLNAEWLETFAVLCELQHFTRAAERLHMTQPGVSQRLRRLEEELGHTLILRDGGRFQLTHAGEAVRALALARRKEERALRAALEVDDPDLGEVRIACSGSLATLLYPHLLEAMARAPGLSVHLEAAPQASVVRGVLQGTFQLGIADHEPSHPRLVGELIGTEALCLVLPCGAPLVPTFAQLEALGFIAHPDGYAYADELLQANFPDHFQGADRLRTRGFVNQISQIPAPVARGLGYTLLPRSGIDAFPGRAHLQLAELPHPVEHELWAVRRAGHALPARFDRISALLSRLVEGLARPG